MNSKKIFAAVIVLLLIGATAAVMLHARANQKLGDPGVKTRPIPGSANLEVELPADIAGYQTEYLPEAAIVTNTLPPDTSFGQCVYTATNGFQSAVNVVLMGSDRSSIHKPQICLTGQGWTIDDSASKVKKIHMDRPVSYELPVMRLVATKTGSDAHGQSVTMRGIYVYWFVDADRVTPSHTDRMVWMARDVLLTGTLERWAYVSYFSVCLPGQEDATFDQMKKLIAASVPEFQLVPNQKTKVAEWK